MSDVGRRVSAVASAYDLRPIRGYGQGTGGPAAGATAFHPNDAQPDARASGDASHFADQAYADASGDASHFAEYAAAESHPHGQPAGDASDQAEYAAAEPHAAG